MAKKYFGQEVIYSKDGRKRLKWGVLMSGLIGGPIYAYAVGMVGNISLVIDGLLAGAQGYYGFLADEIRLVLAGPRLGIYAAWDSFAQQTAQFGVFAYLVGVLGGTVAIYLMIKGVTAING